MRYVPSLRKNLISIGALVGEGLNVRIEDMVLKIVEDSRIVMKGVRRNNLYYLTGSIVAVEKWRLLLIRLDCGIWGLAIPVLIPYID